MAYRRFRARRSRVIRRRKFAPVRRRFRRRFRRPTTSRRRIKQVASRKKFDTQVGATNSGDPVVSNLTLQNTNTYVLSCPTFLPVITNKVVNNTRYRRNQQETFFRGVKERIYLNSSASLTWRRVCFYSYERLNSAQPIPGTNPNTGDTYLRRNLIPFDPRTTSGELLWQGTVGIDFSEDNRVFARLDAQRVRVVYDKTVRLNTQKPRTSDTDTLGRSGFFKRWHGVNKNYRYDQDEEGANRDTLNTESGWCTTSPASPGNFYVLDMFTHGGGQNDSPTVNIGDVSMESTVYWHES